MIAVHLLHVAYFVVLEVTAEMSKFEYWSLVHI